MEMKKKGNPRKGRPYKKYALLIAVVVLLCNPYSLFMGAAVVGEISNRFTLNHFAQPFFDYPLPASSTELSHETEMTYGGNRGCYFKATRVVKSSLSDAELRNYFADIGFPMPYGEPNYLSDDGLVPVFVTEVDDLYHLTILGGGQYEHRLLNFGCR